MRVFSFLFILFTFSSYLFGQAGMTVYAGPSMALSNDPVVTGSGEAHYGYVVGAHGRLNSDPMYFLLTAEYGTFDFLSNNKANFIGGEDLSYIKGKIGLGFDVIKFTRKIALRSKFQGSLLFVNNYPENLLTDPKYVSNGYTTINDGIAGLNTCLGVSIGDVIIDLEYEYGLFNIFKEKKDSKMNFLSLIAGFRF